MQLRWVDSSFQNDWFEDQNQNFEHKNHNDFTAPTNEWKHCYDCYLCVFAICGCVWGVGGMCMCTRTCVNGNKWAYALTQYVWLDNYVNVWVWFWTCGKARNVSDISAYIYLLSPLFFVNYLGSGCLVRAFYFQGQCTWLGWDILLVLLCAEGRRRLSLGQSVSQSVFLSFIREGADAISVWEETGKRFA